MRLPKSPCPCPCTSSAAKKCQPPGHVSPPMPCLLQVCRQCQQKAQSKSCRLAGDRGAWQAEWRRDCSHNPARQQGKASSKCQKWPWSPFLSPSQQACKNVFVAVSPLVRCGVSFHAVVVVLPEGSCVVEEGRKAWRDG